MNRRSLLLALAATGAAAPAFALETVALPLNQHGYRGAPQRGDSIPWEVLGATQTVREDIGADTFERPRFTPTVEAFDGKVIRVNGFMNPMEERQLQRRFFLMAYPLSCPYCLSVGAQYVIDVRAPRGVPFTYDALLIEGRMELLRQDPEGVFYRMQEARRIA
jgi:hypothetical protein